MNEKFLLDTIAMLALHGTYKAGHKITHLQGESTYAKYHIGQDIFLMPTDDFKDNKEMSCNDFGYLYKDGKQLSDIPFRKGGLFSGFKDQQYCSIIAYPELKTSGYSFGNHCIINTKGEIVLDRGASLDYPYHLKGVIGAVKGTYYNLETGKPIVSGSQTLKSDTYFFVQNSYSFGDEAKYEKGVYKIEYATGNYEIFK